jgi:lipase
VVLHAHEWGPPDGPAVLVIHGVRNIGARYRRLAEDGLPRHRVVAPDLRGHGRSTWQPPWDVATHVDDLVRLLDARGIGRTDVVAHSFGGLLALRLAARLPSRVGPIALLDPAVALPATLCRESADADLHGQGRAATFASVDEARVAWLSIRPPAGQWAADEDLATFLEQGDDGLWRYRYSRAAAIVAWSEMALPPHPLTAFEGGVMLVRATRDDFVTPALRERLTRDLGPRFAERTIDAGHMLFWDAHEETAAVLRDFLA